MNKPALQNKKTNEMLAVIIFMALLLWLSNGLFAIATSHTTIGWQLNQNSKLGSILSKITKKALRIDLQDLKLIIIATAPKWNSSIYNLKTHEFFTLSYKELLKLLSVLRINQFEEGKGVVYETRLAKGTLNVSGLQTIDGTIRLSDNKEKIKLRKVAEFWIAPDIRVPQKIVDIFSSLVGLKSLSGMPVRYSRYRKEEAAVLFDTSSIKNIPIQRTDFNISGSFKNGGNVNKLIKEVLGDVFSSTLDVEGEPIPKAKR